MVFILKMKQKHAQKGHLKQPNQTKNIPTLRPCSTISEEKGSGEITTESTYA